MIIISVSSLAISLRYSVHLSYSISTRLKMSILYGGDLKVPSEALQNFSEYLFAKFKEHADHILLVSISIFH